MLRFKLISICITIFLFSLQLISCKTSNYAKKGISSRHPIQNNIKNTRYKKSEIRILRPYNCPSYKTYIIKPDKLKNVYGTKYSEKENKKIQSN